MAKGKTGPHVKKLRRPVQTLIAHNKNKRAFAVHLSRCTVVVMEIADPPTTMFQFSLDGKLYNYRVDRVYQRPARAAYELAASVARCSCNSTRSQKLSTKKAAATGTTKKRGANADTAGNKKRSHGNR